MSKLVSVIVPFFNAGKYIGETIKSVRDQSYKNVELILINDGSTDDSEKIVKSFLLKGDIYIPKKNTGISDSRNVGLTLSKGNYILFLDSDDILEPDFIEKRVSFLENNPSYGFCCSNVLKIDHKGNKINGVYRGIFENVSEEVLLYTQNAITCPSNYLVRKDVLTENNLCFNSSLSSSADRFFLIEISKFARGGYINNEGILRYRVHPESMSNKLSHKLIQDNLTYLKELKKKEYVPSNLKEGFYFKINYILAGSNYKLGNYMNFLNHLIRAFYYSPSLFIKSILKKL